MKLNPIKNDKSTAGDEIVFSIITLLILAAGIALIVLKPSAGIITEALSVDFGIILIILSIMYIPCIIYRLLTNDPKK